MNCVFLNIFLSKIILNSVVLTAVRFYGKHFLSLISPNKSEGVSTLLTVSFVLYLEVLCFDGFCYFYLKHFNTLSFFFWMWLAILVSAAYIIHFVVIFFCCYFSECNRFVIGINSISYVSGKIVLAVLSPGKCTSVLYSPPWNVFRFFLIFFIFYDFYGYLHNFLLLVVHKILFPNDVLWHL